MSYGERSRFKWIYFYCDALRWALVNEVTSGNPRQVKTIFDVIEGINKRWMQKLNNPDFKRWLKLKQSKGCDKSSSVRYELWYLYDLEAELWGKNFEEFLDFKSKTVNILLEPFRLVLLFYLMERALKLMLKYLKLLGNSGNKQKIKNKNDKNLTHSKIRDTVYQEFFNNSKGLIAKFDAFPFPFNLLLDNQFITHGKKDFDYHKNNYPSGSHFLGNRKKHYHYAEVIKAAFLQASKWQLRKRGKKLPIFFFDPLWHYSESYRYRVPLADNFIRRNSFYWGLNLRWLGSIFLNLIELPLYTLSVKFMRDVWEGYKRVAYRPILQKVQMPRWESIRNAKPQKMV